MLPKNKQHFSGLFIVTLVLLAAGLWSGFLVPTALAQAGGAGTAVRGSLPDDLVQWMSKLAAINTFMHILLLILLDFLGYFLRADFFANPETMRALNNIWVLARDIMNIIFALALIGVAFYTIITGNSKYIKEKISQFVIAVILVNFSWFFPRVIIDVANILTGTVYAVPNMLPGFTCRSLDGNPPVVVDCKVITDKMIFGTESEQIAWQGSHACGGTPAAIAAKCPCQVGIGCIKLGIYEDEKDKMEPAYAMLNGLAVSFANLTNLPKVPAAAAILNAPITTGQAAITTFQILMSVVFSFVVQIMIVLPLLGMAVGFFARIIIVWVTTAFMPFSFLGYLFTGKLGTNFLGLEDYIWKPFLVAAFLPVSVGIPIVVGFILLSASASISPPPIALSSQWAAPIMAGMQSLWQMFWMLAAIMIIWIGSFTALSKNKLTAGITNSIKGFGDWVAKGAAQLPLITPIPLQGGAKSAGQLLREGGAHLGAIGDVGFGRASTREEAFRRRMGGNAAEAASLANTLSNDETKTRKIRDAITNLRTATGNDRKTHIEEIHRQLGWAAGSRSGADTLDMVREIANNNRAPAVLSGMRDQIKNELDKERGTGPATPRPTSP